MAFIWNDEPTTKLELSNNNSIEVKPVDLVALIMSSDNEAIPNGLLEQISASLSGQSPDLELMCHSGIRLPMRGEPCMQGNIRAKVVDVTGDEERFTVRVSVISTGKFVPGEVRFGGNSVATLESVREYQWRIGGGDADQARKELPQLGNFINLLVRAASVMPKIVDTVVDPETELDIKRVKQIDKMKIFRWALPREVQPAGMFPQEPAAGLAPASDVQAIPPESGDGVRADASLGALAVQP